MKFGKPAEYVTHEELVEAVEELNRFKADVEAKLAALIAAHPKVEQGLQATETEIAAKLQRRVSSKFY